MKINHIHYILSVFAMLILGSCKKEGEFLTKSVKALKPFDITGYAIGDVLEQYFDGVKVREYYGRVGMPSIVPELVFDSDVTVMQLKKKSTGEVVYEQQFNINDAKNEVPKFYFDGNKISNTYSYPKAQGKDYLMNFFVDGPQDMGPVDIQMDVIEYYYDSNNQVVIVNTTSIPIANNLALGKWSEYFTVAPPPTLTPTQSGTDFYPFLTIKNAKTKQYLVGKTAMEGTFQAEIPDQWTSQGKTQSIHIQGITENKIFYLKMNDLVQMFP